ncbi:enoyl-CoA hydratase/isomerase family protein [Haladaptatus sp. DFWS20]|uniref:enoyl-CoA hydratase/isomerase family protein n=1 Tax=Haladaptatus sp. DFWS20 TaxID=3403467 RepID=UPI003EC129B6
MDPREVAADSETISLHFDKPVEHAVTFVIDRPEARNAMNEQLRSDFKAVFDALEDSEIRAVVLTGSDESRLFVSGADISDLRERDVLEQRHMSQRRKVYDVIANFSLPVIARINGYAFGGGLELALACDIRVAAQDTSLGFPEVGLGLIPGGGGTQRLPRLVGEGQAMRLILTGDPVGAEEAHSLGLVDVVSDDLDETVADLVGSIVGHSPVALEYAKQAITASSNMDLDEGIEFETQLFVQLFATEDKDEGIDAFLEDREPEWSGQ